MRRLFVWLAAALTLLVPATAQAFPPWAFSPSSYDYGTIDANTSASKTFTLTNTSDKTIKAVKASLTGSSAFSIREDTCTGHNLLAKKSCAVKVRYRPTTEVAGSATLMATGKKLILGSLTRVTTRALLAGASTSAAQALCESYGGTYTRLFGNGKFNCVGWYAASFEDLSTKAAALDAHCFSGEFFGTGSTSFVGDEIATSESPYPTSDAGYLCDSVG